MNKFLMAAAAAGAMILSASPAMAGQYGRGHNGYGNNYGSSYGYGQDYDYGRAGYSGYGYARRGNDRYDDGYNWRRQRERERERWEREHRRDRHRWDRWDR